MGHDSEINLILFCFDPYVRIFQTCKRQIWKKKWKDLSQICDDQKSDVCNSLELALIDTDNDILFHDKTETVSKVMGSGVTSSASLATWSWSASEVEGSIRPSIHLEFVDRFLITVYEPQTQKP